MRDITQRFPTSREMARQIGTILKKVQLRKDLHTVLSRSVIDARAGIGLAGRTTDPGTVTPIADFLVEEETPRLEKLPVADEKPRGLRHRLPAFFGWRRG
jgi:hypothetical protein